MHERFYHYRGFEIALQVSPVTTSLRDVRSSGSGCFQCFVRVRESGSVLRLDSFVVDNSRNEPFYGEFEAVLHGCYAAERSVDMRISLKADRLCDDEAVCLL